MSRTSCPAKHLSPFVMQRPPEAHCVGNIKTLISVSRPPHSPPTGHVSHLLMAGLHCFLVVMLLFHFSYGLNQYLICQKDLALSCLSIVPAYQGGCLGESLKVKGLFWLFMKITYNQMDGQQRFQKERPTSLHTKPKKMDRKPNSLHQSSVHTVRLHRIPKKALDRKKPSAVMML